MSTITQEKLSQNPDKCVRRFLFPPQNRLLTPQNYSHVFKFGRKQKGTLFTFIFCKNDFSYARLGLAIAKRSIQLAVKRNKVRRLVRESFRHYQAHLSGLDIVVVAQKNETLSNHKNLREELEQQWSAIVALQRRSY
ncbi:MAG: ribonuclease P protein component [Candidatus Berkiellales bacterium]